MNIYIEEGCIGCGLCADTCPAVFRLNDDGLAEVYESPVADDEDVVREAAENCPVSVISVSE